MAKQDEYDEYSKPEDLEGEYRREVRTEARKIRRRNRIIRILLVILFLLIILMLITYACVSFANKAGRFTINVDEDSFNNYGISIADNRDCKDSTVMLTGDAVEMVDNITKEWLLNPKGEQFYNKNSRSYKTYADIDKVDGSHNGENYVAYTFYLKNGGKETCGYDVSLDIKSVTRGVDEAMRVLVFHNGKPTEYGKVPRKDNKDDKYAMFDIDQTFNGKTVMKERNNNFAVGAVDRFTVVIWLEGWDPECVNDIMGGEVKLEMNFKAFSLSSSVKT